MPPPRLYADPVIQDAFRALRFPGYVPELQRTYELQHTKVPARLHQRELDKHGFWHGNETTS